MRAAARGLRSRAAAGIQQRLRRGGLLGVGGARGLRPSPPCRRRWSKIHQPTCTAATSTRASAVSWKTRRGLHAMRRQRLAAAPARSARGPRWCARGRGSSPRRRRAAGTRRARAWRGTAPRSAAVSRSVRVAAVRGAPASCKRHPEERARAHQVHREGGAREDRLQQRLELGAQRLELLPACSRSSRSSVASPAAIATGLPESVPAW